jgi:hypothetical protein
MNHFSFGDWVDFVRHLKEPSVAAAMQEHLDADCPQCTDVVRVWRHLFDFGSTEQLYHPPDWAVRSVRGYRVLMKPGTGRSRMARLARLVFDSLPEPFSAGIRSSQPPPRQLLYSAGDLLIDLRLERTLSRVHLTGQAQPRSSAGPPVGGIDIVAVRGNETVARTKSNGFGEFQFEFEVQEEDEPFSVVLKGWTSLVIALPGIGSIQGSS